MTADPVVEEVRARGRALTQRYGNDPGAVMDLLRQEAEAHPQAIVDTISIVGSAGVGGSATSEA